MARKQSQGKCNLCGRTVAGAGMTKHLSACRQQQSEKASGKRPGRVFHLVVKGAESPEYWMHLEAPASATLKDLDSFLRNTWLECCGHLSAFTFRHGRYNVTPLDSFGYGDEEEQDMNVALSEVLQPGIEFFHEYDFGSTTTLYLKVAAVCESPVKGKTIRLLARNDPPAIECAACREPATQVCGVCIYDGQGFLCDDCVEEHECGEEMCLPVVNSPRVGVCAYEG